MINIVFQNEYFVICDKPAGVLCTPSRLREDDGRPCLGWTLQDDLRMQIYPVHRLDYEVSGLVMYALHVQAHRISNGWFEHQTIRKEYTALTLPQSYNHIPRHIENPRTPISLNEGDKFEWHGKIMKGKKRAFSAEYGKATITEAQFVKNEGDYLRWKLSPVTGRSHQLRFDLSRHGFPIVGDVLYGSKKNIENWGEHSIALRSYSLDFSKAPQALKFGLPQLVTIDDKFA